MVVEWLLLCERAEIIDGKMNLFGVHNAVYSAKFPLVLQHLPFVINATGDPDEELAFTIHVSGDAEIVQTAEQVVQLNSNGMGLFKFTIDRMVLPDAGRYSLILKGQDGTFLAHALYFAGLIGA